MLKYVIETLILYLLCFSYSHKGNFSFPQLHGSGMSVIFFSISRTWLYYICFIPLITYLSKSVALIFILLGVLFFRKATSLLQKVMDLRGAVSAWNHLIIR
jgi:hypothetical protein